MFAENKVKQTEEDIKKENKTLVHLKRRWEEIGMEIMSRTMSIKVLEEKRMRFKKIVNMKRMK